MDHYIAPASRGTYPVRDGNLVTPLIDGHRAFSRICEAVEAARESVSVTVAFIDIHAEMPGGRGTFFDVLERASTRGLDVRALFWRQPGWAEADTLFHCTGEQKIWFDAQDFSFCARWDWLPKMYCHHQKSWVIDGAGESAHAFIGGINLGPGSIQAEPGHADGSVHDVYVGVEGPAASDAAHNFVQRWNGASERAKADGLWPSPEIAGDLAYPAALAAPAGATPVQLARTIRRGQDLGEVAALGVPPFAIAEGEHSILEQYVNAIAGARRSIYIEDQTLASLSVIRPLIEALQRGVEVVAVAPLPANNLFVEGRRANPDAELFQRLADLDGFDNFTFAGLSNSLGPGRYQDIYVHAKIMLVDDEWTTIGSCNIGDRSFFADSELNAAFWDRDVTKRLRCALMAEHLDESVEHLADADALKRFKEAATGNARLRRDGAAMKSRALRLHAGSYGLE